jgi:hypothetical protein
MRQIALGVLALALVLVGGVAGADDTAATRWVNVNVNEPATGTKVEVHLPLNLVLAVLDGVKVDHFDAGKVKLDIDADVDLARILAAVAEAPDGRFVTVADPGADVEVTKQGGMLLVHIVSKEGDREVVDVKLPAQVLSGIRIDSENQVDVKALLASLAELPNGDLVTVTSNQANVRVWVE